MLDQKGFDIWADEYDREVRLSEEKNTYPFAGYTRVHNGIFQIIMERPGAVVLDLGFGTGVLTKKLYDHGCAVYGQDFSSRMLELASEKMPDAHLYQGDFAEGLAEPLREKRYDFITATYSLHHLTDPQKIVLLRTLLSYLKDNGKILIGDIAFPNREQLEQCRRDAGDSWDEEESYFAADELKKDFPDMTFQPVSFCAGILTLSR